MSFLRGIIPIKTRTDKSNFPTKTCIQSNVLTDPFDGKNFSKNIFYACPLCDGSLIPEANCTLCKRTSVRRCVKCNHVCEIFNHESCRNLMSFGNHIIQKHGSGLHK